MTAVRRIAVLNRGEAAARFMHSAADLRESGPDDIVAIAFHTRAELDSAFVRRADEAFDLDSLPRTNPDARSPYLDHGLLIAAMRATGAELVWPGWGFVAEDPDFVEACERAGLTVVGPPSGAMRLLADKVRAKQLAERSGVPVVMWSGGVVRTRGEVRRAATEIGFPLMVKSAAGGGGMGIREVTGWDGLDDAVRTAQDEARRAFGDPAVFLEGRVDGGRHVEVQVLADDVGTVWPVGVRECSIQRRRQKVVEETGVLEPGLLERLRENAVRICAGAGYRNAGTVEFLVEPDGSHRFMEVNARLQVEHTVTEQTTGLDLVAEQLRIALGGRLIGEPPVSRGHAIEVRVNAEDPRRGFDPAPGRVEWLRLPAGPGVRVDAGVEQGDVVSGGYDPTFMKVIAWGPERDVALRRIRRAVHDTEVVLAGGATNVRFLRRLLAQPDFERGDCDTRWLDEIVARGELDYQPDPVAALAQAGLAAHRARLATTAERLNAMVLRGGHPAVDEDTEPFRLGLGDAVHEVAVAEYAPGQYRVTIDGVGAIVAEEHRDGPRSTLRIGRRRVCTHVVDGAAGDRIVHIDGLPHVVTAGDSGAVYATTPGMVVALMVAVGDVVEVGDTLLTLETMKLESRIAAPVAGRVTELGVLEHTQVTAGALLVRVAADGTTDLPTSPVTPADAASGRRDPIEVLRSVVLGFDELPTDGSAEELAAELRAVDSTARHDDRIALLHAFCDVRALAPGLPSGGRWDDGLVGHLRRRSDPAYAPTSEFAAGLRAALRHYAPDQSGPDQPEREQPVSDLHLVRMLRSFGRLGRIEDLLCAFVSVALRPWSAPVTDPAVPRILDRLISLTETDAPRLAGIAVSARSRLVLEPALRTRQVDTARRLHAWAGELAAADTAGREQLWLTVPDCSWLDWHRVCSEHPNGADVLLDGTLAVLYRGADACRLSDVGTESVSAARIIGRDGTPTTVLAVHATEAAAALPALVRRIAGSVVIELIDGDSGLGDSLGLDPALAEALAGVARISVLVGAAGTSRTWQSEGTTLVEQPHYRTLHPAVAERLELWRLRNFALQPQPSADGTWLLAGTSHVDRRDARLFALAEIGSLTPVDDGRGTITSIPELELAITRCLLSMRRHDSDYRDRSPFGWNRITLSIRPVWDLPIEALRTVAARVAPAARALSLDQIILRMRTDRPGAEPRDVVVHMVLPPGTGVQIGVKSPSTRPVSPLQGHRRAAAELRRRGLMHPWDIVRLLTSPGAVHSDLPPGQFTELDLVDDELVSVEREPGQHTAGVVIGRIVNVTDKHPEGMARIAILNDPGRRMAALSADECSRIEAALTLAETERIPVEWFAVSSGAGVSMDRGTENLDATARVLRRIIESTQNDLPINVVLVGVNVGAQAYWNAEATMLMHTRGVLITVADNAMVLTGKQALDYSGAVSAEDNAGIGGYDRIMGPNGQAQLWAPTVEDACGLLFRHYELAYVAPGEDGVRPGRGQDPIGRDIGVDPHDGPSFDVVGGIIDDQLNPGRKQPFSIRSVMAALADRGETPLERWAHMQDAESAVIWDLHVGGLSTTVIGIESRDLPRRGVPGTDGPQRWSAGTLYPRSSKKVARAINASSGVRPVVVLANLSGFDGSPESLRDLQLEYGAEIGRAVVNFRGPLVFCVLSRYHGGAFVVFSRALNDGMEVLALPGARASVLGGAPAAAVVFSREIEHRAAADPRVEAARQRVLCATDPERLRSEAELAVLEQVVRAELRGTLGREFDDVHTIERARDVGSVHRIVDLADLRATVHTICSHTTGTGASHRPAAARARSVDTVRHTQQ